MWYSVMSTNQHVFYSNPNVHTIEHDIYAALVKSELVTQRQVDKNVVSLL